jgi:3-isopropylmalate/(R)-2-methylmalate dehydratase small subunit
MSKFEWRLKGRCYKFGHDVPHPGTVVPKWLISGRYLEAEDLVPHLFEEVRPGFHAQCKPGDIIVAGRNFGMGPKMNGYVAMQALGLGLIVESMPFLAYRAALGCGLRVLDNCPGILDLAEEGDEIEVDFVTGMFRNHTRGHEAVFSPIPEALRELISKGGTRGWLKDWWKQQAASAHA